MPTISITQEELNAILYFRSEVANNVEATFDESYIAAFELHSTQVSKLKAKFDKAVDRKVARIVAKAK